MSNNKVKGLLKGLRYISQIFDNEKENEMQIGFPTDVKHVAHIGWDGPSVNSAPSWMNEFKGPPGFASAPLEGCATAGEVNDDSSVKWVSEDSNRKGTRVSNSPGRDSSGLPKPSRHRSKSVDGESYSPIKEKPDKPKQSRRSSKHSSIKESSDGSTKPRKSKDPTTQSGGESPTNQSLPAIPKKSQRKKSKDSVGGGSLRSSRRGQSSESDQIPDTVSESESVSVSLPNNDKQQQSQNSDVGESREREFTGIS